MTLAIGLILGMLSEVINIYKRSKKRESRITVSPLIIKRNDTYRVH